MIKKYYFADNEITCGKNKTEIEGFEIINYIEYETGSTSFEAYNQEGEYITVEISREDSELLESLEREEVLTAGKILRSPWDTYAL